MQALWLENNQLTLRNLPQPLKPAEALVFRHAEALRAAFGLAREDVRDTDDFAFYSRDLGGFEEVRARTTAASAYADDYGVDRLIALRAEHGRESHSRSRGGSNER